MPTALRYLLRLGPLNPIAVRLVQNGSRRPRHFYIRAGYLAIVMLVLLWSLVARSGGGTLDYRDLAINAAASFTFIAYLQVTLICVLAPVFMAGAIAQEASPRTWEVLLTTPLTPVQIVLGNLLGRLFFILALILATLPLFGLTQYFGGVARDAVFLSFIISATAAILVGSIAIALSVSRLVGKRAVFSFYVAVVSYLAVTAAVDAYLRLIGAGYSGPGVTWLTALNPFLALRATLNPAAYPAAPLGSSPSTLRAWFFEHPVALWCWGSLALSAVLMLASTFTVRSGGLSGVVASDAGIPWYRRLFGLGASGAEHRPPRPVWSNPIAWREAAARNATLGRIIARWSFVALGGLFGLALVVFFHLGGYASADFQLALFATTSAELAVVTLVAINTAATAVSREREDGTLDLLLTTPITASAYLWGKLRGLIAYLLPMLLVPVGTLAAAGLYVALDGFGNTQALSVTQVTAKGPVILPVILPESALLFPFLALAFIAFVVMVGLQWSLKSKGTLSSVVATVAVVGISIGLISSCGFASAGNLPAVGPALAALSPAPFLLSATDPLRMQASFAESVPATRIAFAVGTALATLAYLAIVYGIHANMVRTFDMTVRRLAGTR